MEKTIGLVVDEEFKYCNVVLGGQVMKMVLQMTGVPNAKIHPPMIIFENDACSYPIQGVNKDVLGLLYRSGPWVWIDKRVFTEWLK